MFVISLTYRLALVFLPGKVQLSILLFLGHLYGKNNIVGSQLIVEDWIVVDGLNPVACVHAVGHKPGASVLCSFWVVALGR